jgi:uncharacterized protein
MEDITIHIEAEINPTESEEKVKTAVNNIIVNSTITIEATHKGSTLIADSKGKDALIKLRNIFRNDRIRDAARKTLFRSISGNKIIFYLNKQVAFAGHVSFSEEQAESPLGPLKVTIETEQPTHVIEWLAEKTA